MSLSLLVERYFRSQARLTQNALTIHYTKNQGNIEPGEMVLVDAGGVKFRLRCG